MDETIELTPLKPVSYDVSELPNTKPNIFDKMDIDNHNINFAETNQVAEETDEKPALVQPDVPIETSYSEGEILESAKILTDMKPSPSLCNDKTPNVSPSNTPGKSRYGRVRKPKLSMDFVSVDRKSFAVLNSSSYDHVYVDETPHKMPLKRKNKRSYHQRNNILLVMDDLPGVVGSNAKTKESTVTNDENLNEAKTEFHANRDHSNLDDSSINSLNSGIIKTYSRKGENTCLNSDDRQNGDEEGKSVSVPQVNYTELNWKVGDVAWAKIGSYPYWPSIVTLEYGTSIYVKPVGKRGSRLAVHVQFFGDRGRRSWVLTTSLIKYESKEQFMELKRIHSKDKLKFKYFNIIRMRDLWEKGITEADTILKLPHEERIQYYQSIYPVSLETYEAEIANMNKVKRTPIKRRKNPEERRGRKRKILSDLKNSRPLKKIKSSPKLSSDADAKPITKNDENSFKKKSRPIDEHMKKRRAFMRRMNRILKQSHNVSGFTAKKGIQNGMKLQRLGNAKFNKLLKDEKGKHSNPSANIFNQKKNVDKTVDKKGPLSIYDFESDEETDVFIGTYNSKFTPQILDKIEEKKDVDVVPKKTEENDEDLQEVFNLEVEKELETGPIPEAEPLKTIKRLKTKLCAKLGNNQKINETVVKENVDALLKGKESNETLNKEKNVDLKKNRKQRERINELVTPKRGRGRPRKYLELYVNEGKTDKKVSVENIKNEKQVPNDNTSENEGSDDRLSAEKKENNAEKNENEGKRRNSERIKNLEKISTENIDKTPLIHRSEFKESEKEKQATGKLSCAEETQKLSRKPQITSHDDDFDSDDDTSNSILNDTEEESKLEEKRRSSSPQTLPTIRLKKSSKVFTGLKFEKVCLICEKPGDTVRCRGPCSGTFHIECVQKSKAAAESNVALAQKPRGRGRRPRKSPANLVDCIKTEPLDTSVEAVCSENQSDEEKVVTGTNKLKKDEQESMPLRCGNEDQETVVKPEIKEAYCEIDRVVDNDACSTSTSVKNPETGRDIEVDGEKVKNYNMLSADAAGVGNSHKGTTATENTSNLADAHTIEENSIPEENLKEEQSSNKAEHDVVLTVDQFVDSETDGEKGVTTLTQNENSASDIKLSQENDLSENISGDAEESVKKIDVNLETVSESGKVDDVKIDSTNRINVEGTSMALNELKNKKEPSISDSASKAQDESVSEKDESSTSDSIRNKLETKKDEPSTRESIPNGLENKNDGPSTSNSDMNEGENNKDELLTNNSNAVENDDAGSDASTKAENGNGVDFRCNKCIENIQYPCFTCGKEVQEKTGETERYSCYLASCGRVYHKECLKAWPQATWTWRGNNSNKLIRNGSNSVAGKETLMCPQHYCHTCISDNPAVQKNKQSNEVLVRCTRCPTAYHKRVHCIPAGTEVLTMSQIICPRHYEPPGAKQAHFNTSWCFICCIGGSLICCDECPTSFHAECLKLRPEEYEGRYICDDCQTGRYLLYGEVAWVKLGHYRWWPALILYPNQVPENIQNLPHRRGEFAVKFFGSHNYNWVNRGRAFVYQEGDSGKKNCKKNSVDLTFEKALIEAEEAYQKQKKAKAARDEEARVGLKPPKYVRIKTNKPVGNVRIVELNTSNITACECDPKSEKPCAPESDCLNRMLLVECNPLVCPAGEQCHNQAFEQRLYPPLMPYKTDKRGWGLKTLVDMKKGDFIIEYVGEMIDEEEYKRRVSIMHKNQEDNYYFLTIDKDRMLDAGPKGNVSRFMNHSCEPNCETQKWTVNGDTRVGLFALKTIPANSELVFNYNLINQGNEMKPCFCGSEKCSGFIGVKATKNGNSSNDEETRKKSNEENKKRSLIDHDKKRKRIRNPLDRRNLVIEKGIVKKRNSAQQLGQRVQIGKDGRLLPIQRKADARFKSKISRVGRFSKSIESLNKHRELVKKKMMNIRSGPNKRPAADKRSKLGDKKRIVKRRPLGDKKPSVHQEFKDEKKESIDQHSLADKNSAVDEQSLAVEKSIDIQTPVGKKSLVGKQQSVDRKSLADKKKSVDKQPSLDKKSLADKQCSADIKSVAVNKQSSSNKKPVADDRSSTNEKPVMDSEAPDVKERVPSKQYTTNGQRASRKREMETRGRKKTPRTEQEKQELLFRMIKRRIERKFDEMSTLLTLDEECFICTKSSGELLFCDNNKCPRAYHLDCLNRSKWPSGRWLCPWHYCNICKSIRRVLKCSKCVNSYCSLHSSKRIFQEQSVHDDDEEQFVCTKHRPESMETTNFTEKESKKQKSTTKKEIEEKADTKGNSSSEDRMKSRLNDDVDTRSGETGSSGVTRPPIHGAVKSDLSNTKNLNNSVSKKLPEIKRKSVGKKRNVQDHPVEVAAKKPRRDAGNATTPVKNKDTRPKTPKSMSTLRNKRVFGANIKADARKASISDEKVKSKLKTEQLDNDAQVKRKSDESVTGMETNAIGEAKGSKNMTAKLSINKASSTKTTNSVNNDPQSKDVEVYKETDFYVNNTEGSDDEYINLEVEVINDVDSN